MVLSNLPKLGLANLVKQCYSLECDVANLITLCFLIPLQVESFC